MLELAALELDLDAAAPEEAHALLAGRNYSAVVADLKLVGNDIQSGFEALAAAADSSSRLAPR